MYVKCANHQADFNLYLLFQYPWSVNRIFVQETVYEEFQEKFKKKYFYVTSTDPYLKSTDYSKLIDFKFGAKEAGSNVINENTDSFVNVIAFRTANEAANLSNNTRLGLACSVWTENINLANEIASKLKVTFFICKSIFKSKMFLFFKVGIVWINTHGCITAGCTFTPYKKSGKGYFGGIEGEVYLNKIKNVLIIPICFFFQDFQNT